MADLACIGIAIPEKLLEEFDRLIERGGATRSEAVRDLVRKELVDEIAASPSAEVYGASSRSDPHRRVLQISPWNITPGGSRNAEIRDVDDVGRPMSSREAALRTYRRERLSSLRCRSSLVSTGAAKGADGDHCRR